MTTFDNAPPQPDWTPCPGNTCGGCGASRNLCQVLKDIGPLTRNSAPVIPGCCQDCTHQAR